MTRNDFVDVHSSTNCSVAKKCSYRYPLRSRGCKNGSKVLNRRFIYFGARLWWQCRYYCLALFQFSHISKNAHMPLVTFISTVLGGNLFALKCLFVVANAAA